MSLSHSIMFLFAAKDYWTMN